MQHEAENFDRLSTYRCSRQRNAFVAIDLSEWRRLSMDGEEFVSTKTCGDTHRYLRDREFRYGHVLNPRTGWPIADAPRSVMVNADTCSEAGLLAKLALLRGARAEEFLKTEQVRAWCVR